MDFYVRVHNLYDNPSLRRMFVFSSGDLGEFGESYYDSDFDCRYLDTCYLMFARYNDGITNIYYNYGSAVSSDNHIVEYQAGKNFFGRFIADDLGSSSRTMRLYSFLRTSSLFKSFYIGFWTGAGYTDPASDFTTFKTEICTQIKDAVDLSSVSDYSDWNVYFYRIENDEMVIFYWPGNDPNRDEIITI